MHQSRGNTSMEREVADRNNREGMMGWLNPRRYGWERVSYWLQRLTGVGLLAYFIAHIYETPDRWRACLMGSILRAYSDYSWSCYSNSGKRNVRLPFSKRNPSDICTWRQGAWQTRQARLPL